MHRRAAPETPAALYHTAAPCHATTLCVNYCQLHVDIGAKPTPAARSCRCSCGPCCDLIMCFGGGENKTAWTAKSDVKLPLLTSILFDDKLRSSCLHTTLSNINRQGHELQGLPHDGLGSVGCLANYSGDGEGMARGEEGVSGWAGNQPESGLPSKEAGRSTVRTICMVMRACRVCCLSLG